MTNRSLLITIVVVAALLAAMVWLHRPRHVTIGPVTATHGTR